MLFCLDKPIRVQQFLKRNISPFCLSHHLKYIQYVGVLRLPKRKNLLVSGRRFSANSVLQRRDARSRNTIVLRARATKPMTTMFSRKNYCIPIALSMHSKKAADFCRRLSRGPSDRSRTCGLLNPIQARYQSALHPDISLTREKL